MPKSKYQINDKTFELWALVFGFDLIELWISFDIWILSFELENFLPFWQEFENSETNISTHSPLPSSPLP